MKYLLTAIDSCTRSSASYIRRFKSSQQWLARQMKDPYVEKARVSTSTTSTIEHIRFIKIFHHVLDNELSMSFVIQTPRDQ